MKTNKLLATLALAWVVLIAGCKKDDFTEIAGTCPVVLSTNPVNSATGVPLVKIITVTFSENMNPATIIPSNFSVLAPSASATSVSSSVSSRGSGKPNASAKQTSAAIAGTITYSGMTASFTPSSPLSPNTTYTGWVSTGVRDLMGNSLQSDYVWTFKTDALPTVVSTDPANLATGVTLNKVIRAKFTHAMNAATLTASTFTVTQGASTVAGTISYADSVVSFTPTSNLTANTTYTGTLTTGVKNTAGTSMGSNYTWTFSTGAVPTVLTTDPAANATNVVLNKVVSANFNQTMDPSSVTASTFTLKAGASSIAGVVTYSGTTASFTPNSNLTPGTVYTATLTTGIRNTSIVPLAADHIWSFTTAGLPTVLTTDPANLATSVAVTKIVGATFSETMDASTITTSTFTLKDGATSVAGTVNYSGSTATFTPNINLLAGTVYTATLTTAVKSTSGIALATDYVWTFTTLAASVPTVISTDPVNLASSVPLNKVVGATFSVPMNSATLTTSSFTLKAGLVSVAGTVNYSGSTATFTPNTNLTAGTVYTATVTTGAKNTSGTSLGNDFVWTFTTLAATAPTVISTDPVNLATSVAVNKIVGATFSVPMDALTLTTSTFTVKAGLVSVSGVVNYSGSTATFTPNSNLLTGTVYTATITNGAKNTSGTALANDFVWTFTTVAALAPTVISTDPVNLATSVLLNKVVSATFSVPMDALTLTTSTFTLKAGLVSVAGVVGYSGSTATFTPNVNLTAGTVYTATITNGAKNASGTSLANNFVWSFTTAAALAPTVTSVDPLNLATGIAVNKIVGATFSVPMDALTLTTSTFTLKAGLVSVSGVVGYSGSTATFTPNTNLLNGTVYTATITTGAKNASGTALANDFVWSFTTVAALAPTVTVTDPLNLATGVAANKVVSATFSVPMNSTTLTTSTFTLKDGLVSVLGVVGYSGSTATFTPNVNLSSNTVYTATVTTGAQNPSGTGLASDKVWTFTTAAALAPTVTVTDPLNLATNVALNKVVSATFSVPMDALTLTNLTFTLKDGATSISGAVNYSGSSATFTPNSDLVASTTYTATITTGAKNTSGTSLASNKVWTFTTVAPLGPGAVNLGSAADFAAIGKAGISTTGTTSITGDIGVSPGAATLITGFGLTVDASGEFATTTPSTLVVGKVYASDYAPPTPAKMTTAVSDMENALTTAMGMTLSVINDLGAGNVSGMTLAPGLYKWSTGLLITNQGVTLSGGPKDTWVFQIAQDLTIDNSAMVTLSGGALAKNVFWVTSTQATLGTSADVSGNIISQTLISLNTGAKVTGRLLAQTQVTLNAATVVQP